MKIEANTQEYGIINYDLIYNKIEENWEVWESTDEAFKEDRKINSFYIDNSEESQEIVKEWVKNYINSSFFVKDIICYKLN